MEGDRAESPLNNHSVTDTETVWITLSDGTRLAARIWAPNDAAAAPVPAVLEYLPYRRRDRHRGDDGGTHPHLAAFGFACMRVDARGSGDSDGTSWDEYTEREHADIEEVIAWLAAQPWCNGRVGMMGLSWSGFNSLQVAARQPPALYAIISTGASDDRYANDMHYSGGCLLNDNIQYGGTLLTYSAAPPDPEIVGDRWREMWLERLEAVQPAWMEWMSHPERDAYWRHASVCEDPARIRCPVMAISGWADGYVDFVLRLLSRLSAPCQGLVGPWGHAFPHLAGPGPRVDFVRIAARWFGHWLRGDDNGADRDPKLRAWIQESEPPRAWYGKRSGGWTVLDTWPTDYVQPVSWYVSDDVLAPLHTRAEQAGSGETRTIRSPVTTGLCAGEWAPYGRGPDMPTDQRSDDGQSLCFTSEPLNEETVLLGTPRLDVRLASDAAGGKLVARLCDVAPDGSSRRVSQGLMNLAHRAGHHRRHPPEPGTFFDLHLAFKDTGYRVPRGHCLRLALATACWPMTWPEAESFSLTVETGSIRLDCPVLARDQASMGGVEHAGLPAAVDRPGDPRDDIDPPRQGRIRFEHDAELDTTRVRTVRHLGTAELHQTRLRYEDVAEDVYDASPNDPSRTRTDIYRRLALTRGDWNVAVDTRSVVSRAADGGLHAEAVIEAFDDGIQIFSRRWSRHYG